MYIKYLQSGWINLLLALVPNLVSAQTVPPDEVFGTVSQEHLEMTSYIEDTSANALYLLDKGVLKSFTENVLLTSYNVHRRLKIFNINALSEGQIEIPYYAKDVSNTLKKLEILVHYPDGRKIAVISEEAYIQDLGDGYFAKKVLIPDLQEGVIIEYQYYIENKNIIMPEPWYFQGDIPRLKSVLEIQVIGYNEFQYIINVPEDVLEDLADEMIPHIYINTKPPPRRFVLNNVPAIRDEPFSRAILLYHYHLDFRRIKSGGPDRLTISNENWEDLARELAKSAFDKEYTRSVKTNKLLQLYEEVYDPLLDTLQTIKAAQEFVARNIRWNGWYSDDINVNDAFMKKEGSYKQISFALLACLKHAGIEAYPVLIRLRRKGYYQNSYTESQQFQTVAVLVKLNNEEFLMDASSPYYQPGEVDIEILNGLGWIPHEGTSRWVNIVPAEEKDITQLNLIVDAAGRVNGTAQLNVTGNIALAARRNIASNNYLDIARAYFLDSHDNFSISNFTCDTSFTKGKPLKMGFNLDFGQLGTLDNDLIYLPALPHSYFESNPFKDENRTFPISFPNPIRSHMAISYTLPEGYIVEELPTSTNMSCEKEGITLTYSITSPSPSTVYVTYKMQLKSLEYSTEAYETLKQFFDAMSSRVNDQIVLRKIE